MGVNRLFDRGALLHPHRNCLVEQDRCYTYAEIRARTDGVAAFLLRQQLAGSKVAVLSKNCAGALQAMLAIYRAGAVYVPLNALNHLDENVAIAQNCEIDAVFYQQAMDEDVRALQHACPSIRLRICLDGDGGDASLEALVHELPPERFPEVDRDQIVSIYSTGGTTGRPKGVQFTPLTWEIMAANMYHSLPRAEHIVYLVAPPITHAAGTIGLLLLAEGATLVVHPRFDAGAVLDAIERQRITHLYLPPTAVYQLLSHPSVRQRDYRSLRSFIYTSAPMSTDKLLECIEIFGPVMTQYWGQTEVPVFATCLTPDDHVVRTEADRRRLASCGRPMLLTDVAVMGPDGSLLPRGERGELVLRGNLVMAGYYNNPQANADASRNGWHRTGDVGLMDENGYVFIVDRLKDMIISGGFNIYPGEVEQVLWSHPAVQECAVVGAPDEKWGEAVTAVVECKPGAQVDAETLIRLCKERLGSVKAPKQVVFWDQLPRTAVGKVSKKEIREQFWHGQLRRI